MKCVICKTGETRPGTASVVLERAGTTVLIRDVPGEICDTCGEVYHDAEITNACWIRRNGLTTMAWMLRSGATKKLLE